MTGPTEGVLLRAVLFGGAVLLAAGGLLHLADLAVRDNAAWGFTGAVGAVWSGVLVVERCAVAGSAWMRSRSSPLSVHCWSVSCSPPR
ncbi:MAG TPA: hypothetical protein VK925_08910 [Jiangellaceae bacterium]|nr:hypothetical protein [Jiangellaceae bacterium]